MIRKQAEFAPRSEPGQTIKPLASPSLNTKLSVPKSNPETSIVFDATRIIQRYRVMRDSQHEILAGVNLSEEMKRQLFGFSEQHYLTNNAKLGGLLIQNHPLEGRMLMTKHQHEIYLDEKEKEKQLKNSQNADSLSILQNRFDPLDRISVSSLGGDKIAELSQDSILMNHRSQQT